MFKKGGEMKVRIGCLALSVIMIFSSVSIAIAKEKTEEMTVKAKKITGEISGIGPRYISIIYERDKKKGTEYEILLPIDEDVKFTRKSLSELEIGDKISVECDDYFKIDEEGRKICALRVARQVKFLRSAVKGKLIGVEEQDGL